MSRSILGIALRVGIVLSWCAVMAWHANAQRLAGLGDLRPAMRAHLGSRLSYHLTIERAGLARAIGSCRWNARALGGGGILTMVALELDDLSVIPGVSALTPLLAARIEPAPAMDADTSAAVHHPGRLVRHHAPQLVLSWEETTTAGGDLSSLAASAHLAGLGAVAWARLQPDHVSVSYSAPGYDGARTFPALPGVHALAVIAMLPAGLRASKRFTVPMIGLDPGSLAPRVVHARFACTAEEELVTDLGVRLLMRVEQSTEDGRLASTLWCDDLGLVYRQRWRDPLLQMDLTGVAPDAAPAQALPSAATGVRSP